MGKYLTKTPTRQNNFQTNRKNAFREEWASNSIFMDFSFYWWVKDKNWLFIYFLMKSNGRQIPFIWNFFSKDLWAQSNIWYRSNSSCKRLSAKLLELRFRVKDDWGSKFPRMGQWLQLAPVFIEKNGRQIPCIWNLFSVDL